MSVHSFVLGQREFKLFVALLADDSEQRKCRRLRLAAAACVWEMHKSNNKITNYKDMP